METKERDLIFAKFLGWKLNNYFKTDELPREWLDATNNLIKHSEYDDSCNETSDLGFSTDWNKVMILVRKITTIINLMGNKPNEIGYNFGNYKNLVIGLQIADINSVLEKCFKFILWYNKINENL